MKRRHLLALLLCCAFAPAHAGPPEGGTVHIGGAEFGLFSAGAAGELVFTPTDVVPLANGQRYGWIVEVRTGRRSLSVREEYLLPTAATEAAGTIDLSRSRLDVPLPRRSQVSQRQLAPVDGLIYGEWVIGAGEPPGRRHLQVIVEGQLAGSFDYEVK